MQILPARHNLFIGELYCDFYSFRANHPFKPFTLSSTSHFLTPASKWMDKSILLLNFLHKSELPQCLSIPFEVKHFAAKHLLLEKNIKMKWWWWCGVKDVSCSTSPTRSLFGSVSRACSLWAFTDPHQQWLQWFKTRKNETKQREGKNDRNGKKNGQKCKLRKWSCDRNCTV